MKILDAKLHCIVVCEVEKIAGAMVRAMTWPTAMTHEWEAGSGWATASALAQSAQIAIPAFDPKVTALLDWFASWTAAQENLNCCEGPGLGPTTKDLEECLEGIRLPPPLPQPMLEGLGLSGCPRQRGDSRGQCVSTCGLTAPESQQRRVGSQIECEALRGSAQRQLRHQAPVVTRASRLAIHIGRQGARG